MSKVLHELLCSLDVATLRKLFNSPLKNDIEKIIRAYAGHGVIVTKPVSPANFCETMVCAEYDGVPYCVDCHDDLAKVPASIEHRRLTIERHHDLIKEVHAMCTERAGTPVWALCGGGGQMSIFFGNHTGYLAELSLSHVNLCGKSNMAEYDNARRTSKYVMQVQWDHNDKLFRGFKHPSVFKRTSASFN